MKVANLNINFLHENLFTTNSESLLVFVDSDLKCLDKETGYLIGTRMYFENDKHLEDKISIGDVYIIGSCGLFSSSIIELVVDRRNFVKGLEIGFPKVLETLHKYGNLSLGFHFPFQSEEEVVKIIIDALKDFKLKYPDSTFRSINLLFRQNDESIRYAQSIFEKLNPKLNWIQQIKLLLSRY